MMNHHQQLSAIKIYQMFVFEMFNYICIYVIWSSIAQNRNPMMQWIPIGPHDFIDDRTRENHPMALGIRLTVRPQLDPCVQI